MDVCGSDFIIFKPVVEKNFKTNEEDTADAL